MEENQKNSLKNGIFRFMSHFIAVSIGLICMLFLLKAPYELRAVPLLIAFGLCGYLIGKQNKYSTMGNTIGIAMAIMLLTDPNSQVTLQIIFARFYNVMVGITIAFLMLNPFEKILFKK